jgi:hypothetical protein
VPVPLPTLFKFLNAENLQGGNKFSSFRDFAGALRRESRRNLQRNEVATPFPYATPPQKRVRNDEMVYGYSVHFNKLSDRKTSFRDLTF